MEGAAGWEGITRACLSERHSQRSQSDWAKGLKAPNFPQNLEAFNEELEDVPSAKPNKKA